MTVLGVRCSTTDFSYAALTGSGENPKVLEVNTISMPANALGRQKAPLHSAFSASICGVICKKNRDDD